jgi:ABC-2 type transport system permease protein
MILSVERAIAALTLRQILARRRALALLALGLLPVPIALLARESTPWLIQRVVLDINLKLVLLVLLPLVALVIGTGAFGGEIEDGTILYLLAKPVARWRMVLVRIVVSAVATIAFVVPGAVLAGLIAAGGVDAGRAVSAFPIATAGAALVYSALFVALSLSTRRALVVGLIYVVLWEGIIAPRFDGTKLLSVNQFALALADRLTTIHPSAFDATLAPLLALIMASVLTGLATLHAIRRLARFEVGDGA